jgi:glycerophosphoryl diester phosphodiesterase
LVQLMASEGGPWDQGGATYAGMAAADGLRQVAEYATAVGVEKDMVFAVDDNSVPQPTRLVADAHAAGLARQVL